MAAKNMTPQQANELLTALDMATAACTRAMGQVDHYTDLYDQFEDTRRQLTDTRDTVVRKFVPPLKAYAGRK